MRLHEGVAGLAQLIVNCKVVNQHQSCTDALSRAAPLVDLAHEFRDQGLRVVLEHKNVLVLRFGKSLTHLLVHFPGLGVEVVQHYDRNSSLVLVLLPLAKVLEH